MCSENFAIPNRILIFLIEVQSKFLIIVPIKKIEQKIDSIEFQNDSLQIEKQELFDKIQGYDIEIQNLNKKIYVIRKDYKKKLDAVNLFTDAELQKFFSDRYNIDNDSIK